MIIYMNPVRVWKSIILWLTHTKRRDFFYDTIIDLYISLKVLSTFFIFFVFLICFDFI